MTSGKTAFVFPGQGSQHAGMGSAVAANYPAAKRVFEAADRALESSLSTLCFDGPEEELTLTENTQPAILTASTAIGAVLSSFSVVPDCVAGHSLGEYSALVAVGALALEEAVVLVRKRGRYMQEAVPVGEGAMAAILGLSGAEVSDICSEAAGDEIVEPANFNGAGQVVVAGHEAAVRRACGLAKERGARRALPLAVSAPFHCRLMEPAATKLAKDLDAAVFSNFTVPLFTNVDAQPITTGDEARRALKRQVASPVRWEEIVESMADAGVRRFIEVGPGKVLSGLVRKIVKGAEVLAVGTPEGIERLRAGAEVV